jgi:hypothetical protein
VYRKTMRVRLREKQTRWCTIPSLEAEYVPSAEES